MFFVLLTATTGIETKVELTENGNNKILARGHENGTKRLLSISEISSSDVTS